MRNFTCVFHCIILSLFAVAFTGCKLDTKINNIVGEESSESGTATVAPLIPINASNKTNYTVSGTCTRNGATIVVNLANTLTLATDCVQTNWAINNIDISSIPDGSLTVTARDSESSLITGGGSSTSVIKDTTPPTMTISVAGNYIFDGGTYKDIEVHFSEPVSRSIATVNSIGEKIFLVSSSDGNSLGFGDLISPTEALIQNFYISNSSSSVKIFINYSSSENQDLYFKDAAGNILTTDSNTLTFNSVCGDSTHLASMGGGYGTVAYPYEIRNIDQFNSIRNANTCKYKLMNNIDASSTSSWNGGTGFYGIHLGVGGHIDGQNYEIDGIVVNASGGYGGVFNYLEGTVENITFDNVNMLAVGNSNGMLGYATATGQINNFTLKNSSFETLVTSGDAFGGIFGYSLAPITNLTISDVIVKSNQAANNINGVICCAMASINGLTIANLQVIGHSGSRVEFFGYMIDGSSYENISITNSSVTGGNVTGFVPTISKPVSNLTISNFTVTGTNSAVGIASGLTAQLSGVSISNLTVSTTTGAATGLIGYNSSSGDLTNLTMNNINVTSSNNVAYGIMTSIGKPLTNLTVSNLSVSGTGASFGIASTLTSILADATISNLTVSTTTGAATGLIGTVSATGTVDRISINQSNITSTNNIANGTFSSINGPVKDLTLRNINLSGRTSIFGLASTVSNNGSSTFGSLENILFDATITGITTPTVRGLAGTLSGNASIQTAIAKISTTSASASNNNCGIGTMSNNSLLQDVALECTGTFSAVAVQTMSNTSTMRRTYIRGPKGGSGTLTGNFITTKAGTAVVADSFYNSQFGINAYGTIGRTTSQLQSSATYSSWDFSKWSLTTGFPFLTVFSNE